MNRYFHLGLIVATISSTFASPLLFAGKTADSAVIIQENVAPEKEGERSEVRSRPLTKKDKRTLKQRLARKEKAAEKKQNKMNKLMKFARYPVAKSSYAIENQGITAPHSIHDLSQKGDTIEIENGTVFKICDYDASTASLWNKNDVISIKPNHSWFSSYEYTIHNVYSNNYVQAKISLGPFNHSPYTRRIVQINQSSGELVLDDGSYYRVSIASELRKWSVNDKILVGDNDMWFAWGYNNIVINVATDSYLTAKRLY